ncbi:hypothetical protein [Agitococcus lubricus]|uniref:RiboL-PSP-HEPN domain-containing protein n=1 Tax=Agitococcus lubricus TaxID=1077255 RepID=A0A2T5J212_9GAMM|nr:hypothetical protein [Agitococcus lubricus]PTQ90481.1 hypothetical protein C8N29_103236 [Agitococcus lubricus]
MSNRIDYPFKSVEKIFEQDAPLSNSIALYHAQLDSLKLHEGVPAPIRQLFETAKNISLYAFYAYRLHQPAELVAYSAFEMALRERAKNESPELFTEKTVPMFKKLCDLAISKSWFQPESFLHLENRAYRHARQAKELDLIKRMEAEGLSEAELDEPTDEDVLNALKEFKDFASPLLESFRHLRNNLAHGSSMLMPSSIRTLRVLAEAINQLFNMPHT